MRNGIALFLISGWLMIGCSPGTEKEARESGVEIWFEQPVHDYGEIPEGGDGSHAFAFTNLGDEPVVINRVRSTCGCTVPTWPGEPIEPGASGEIPVTYNTSQTGSFIKSVYVYSTASNSPVKLQVKGKVVPSS
jgi:hypothetical protein